MTTFKHADKVTCMITRDGTEHDITDAKISIDKEGDLYICHNNPDCDCAEADDMLGYPYCLWLSSNFTNYYVTNLKLEVRSVRDADVGDIVVRDTKTYMVIDSLPNSVLALPLPQSNYSGLSEFPVWCPRDHLKEEYTFVEPTPPQEMTLDEVCKALGRDIIIKN